MFLGSDILYFQLCHNRLIFIIWNLLNIYLYSDCRNEAIESNNTLVKTNICEILRKIKTILAGSDNSANINDADTQSDTGDVKTETPFPEDENINIRGESESGVEDNIKPDHVQETTNPFPCPLCEKQFCTKENARKHIEKVHKRQKSISCKLCGKSFIDQWRCEGHIRRNHKTWEAQCNPQSYITYWNVNSRRDNEETGEFLAQQNDETNAFTNVKESRKINETTTQQHENVEIKAEPQSQDDNDYESNETSPPDQSTITVNHEDSPPNWVDNSQGRHD